MQLIQPNVQKSSKTMRPRRSAKRRGPVPIQSSPSRNSEACTVRAGIETMGCPPSQDRLIEVCVPSGSLPTPQQLLVARDLAEDKHRRRLEYGMLGCIANFRQDRTHHRLLRRVRRGNRNHRQRGRYALGNELAGCPPE